MRPSISVMKEEKFPKGIFLTVFNYKMIKGNLAVRWWFDEVVVCEAEQVLDIQNANQCLLYTRWDFYNETKGWLE